MQQQENIDPKSNARFSRFYYIFSALLAFISWLVLLLVFYPGHLSPDSINQYEQAVGRLTLSDWHPPFMTLLWQLLINISGKIGSMLALQLALLVGSIFLVSAYAFKESKSWFFSILPYLLLLYPGIVNIAGAIWKDVLMADVFLLGSALLLWVKYLRLGRRVRVACLVAVATLFIAGSMIRYNAIIAGLPLFVVAASEMTTQKYRQVIGSIGLVSLAIISPLLISVFANVEKDNPLTAVMLDDVTHMANTIEPGKSEVTKIISGVRYACKDWVIPMNSYIACTSVEQKKILKSNYAELTRIWISGIMRNPIEYIKYRGKVFGYFLFPQKERLYIYADGIVQNTYGLSLRNPGASTRVGQYIRYFSDKGAVFIFQGWFWLVVLFVMGGIVIKSKLKEKKFILGILLSGSMYILGYFFVAVETDYRYIYWSVCAALLATAVYMASAYATHKHNTGNHKVCK